MNIQAMMKQAQKLQKEMMETKKIIDETVFTGESSFVKVNVYGNKKIKEIMIEEKDLSSDDIEMLQDMIVVAINDAMNKIDKETENKMGKYTQGMPGLF
jgi:DNA-binding YbaB/EbfC family protein